MRILLIYSKAHKIPILVDRLYAIFAQCLYKYMSTSHNVTLIGKKELKDLVGMNSRLLFDCAILLSIAKCVPLSFIKMTRTIVGKKCVICTLFENSKFRTIEDVNFFMRGNVRPHSIPLRWMCDHNICYPDQNQNEINILIDHDWVCLTPGVDRTDELTKHVCSFATTNTEVDKPITIKRLYHKGGICMTINPSEPLPSAPPYCVRTDYEKLCDKYRKTDIFVVTHPESIGMTVIDAAMCGALILAPKGYIKPQYLNTVYHMEFSRVSDIDWVRVIDKVDHKKSRDMALKNSWESKIKIITNTIDNYRLYRKRGFIIDNNIRKKIFRV